MSEGDFELHIDSLSQLVPWFFSLDHTHYARSIPIHHRNMIILAEKHSAACQKFLRCNFIVKKTVHAFSNIVIDQAHEQNNTCLKDDGGAVHLTQNPEF